MRDCVHAPKDNAKIDAFQDDERIVLATRWFHLVRVGRDVLNPSHPLHALFAGDAPPHMALLSSDGAKRIDMQLMPTSRALWTNMLAMLKRDYEKPADAALGDWRGLLSKFDVLDAKRAKLMGEKHRATNPKKVADLESEIEAIDEEKAKLQSSERRIVDLGLKATKPL